MKSQTARRPDDKRPTRSGTKTRKYSKQTARFEGKRDGKPLIFGWGGHLSHNQKVQLQRRVAWSSFFVVGLLIVLVFVGFWIDFNIVIPGLPITSVNGHQIPQSLYRKMVAFNTELAENNLNGPNGLTAQRDSLRKQVAAQQSTIDKTTQSITDLNKELKALKPGSSSQRTNLTNQIAAAKAQLAKEQGIFANFNQQYTNITQNTIPQAQQNFTISQVGNDSVSWLQNDELILEWAATQSTAVQAKVNPTDNAVNRAMNDFKANIPKSSSYSAFLSRDGVSDNDMQAMMRIKLRRGNMQTYLASLEVSPTYQVEARMMTIDTLAHAKNFLNQLKHGGDFAKIAKASSADSQTASKGGDLGWLARGQYAQIYQAAIVENWLFAPNRPLLNQLSPVLVENGTYRIVQLLDIDHSRAVDAATLKTLKTNALSDWLLQQQALPTTKITDVDQNKLVDPANVPADLPQAAPAVTPTTGVPGLP